MADLRRHHISSAVVAVRPEHAGSVAKMLATLEGTEIYAREGGRIVVVMEGASSGELGDRLNAIGALEGVIAANMVFEHIEEPEVGQT